MINKFSLSGLLLVLLVTACSSGSVPGEDDGGDNGGGSTACEGCPCVGDLEVSKPQNIGGSNICSVGGTLTESATLPALTSDKWHIVDSLIVESGTLTVEEGVEVLAESGEYIYVMPGASLRAIGTESSPILFSSEDEDYDLDTSASSSDGWTGLVIDTGSSVSANRLEYVVIAEAGVNTDITSGPQNVNAGITLLGRHDNTVFNYVQVHDTFGDGVYLNGEGLENVAKLDTVLVTGAGRDGIHYFDFSGLVKDALVIHRSAAYSDAAKLGGRAGIRAGGINSLPLITNVTLVGNDGVSSDTNTGEYGLLVEANVENIRVANSIIVNFENACYSVSGSSDLSTVLSGIDAVNTPTDSFIDGVHCVDESTGTATIGVGDSSNIPDRGVGNGNGLRFYENTNANFEGENTLGEFSSNWLLNSIGSLSNGDESDCQNSNFGSRLCLFNDGDTNEDGSVDVADTDSSQFVDTIDGLTEAIALHFYSGPVPIEDSKPLDLVTFDNHVFVNPSTGIPLDPQPLPTNFLIEGFIAEIVSNGFFDLTRVGAVKNSNIDVFNNWTLQGGAVSPVVIGFDPE